MGGAVKFVKNVGKEITGDAERERKRAARDAANRAAAEQERVMAELEAEKAAADEKEAKEQALLQAKGTKTGKKSTGRRGTILSKDKPQSGMNESGADLKTLLGS